MRFSHQPVLLSEVIEYLALKPGQNVIDCTLGGGGHSVEILKATAPDGFLLGIDLSEDSLKRADENLKEFKGRYKLIQDNFKNLRKIITQTKNEQRNLGTFNSILSDLGLAFYQFKEEGQGGFSFSQREKLDMRLDKSSSLTAEYIINKWPEGRLQEIFKNNGGERHALGIAKEIVKQRKKKKISQTTELAEIVESFYQGKPAARRIHPATKTFQALRIAVNDEFNNLKTFLKDSLEILKPGGRVVVISYHSGEDKIVKEFFKKEATGCLCPPSFPVCRCEHQPKIKIITKKLVVPTQKEIQENPAARSAKLRAAEVI